MIKTIYICDHCKKEIVSQTNPLYKVSVAIRPLHGDAYGRDESIKYFRDVCEECLKKSRIAVSVENTKYQGNPLHYHPDDKLTVDDMLRQFVIGILGEQRRD